MLRHRGIRKAADEAVLTIVLNGGKKHLDFVQYRCEKEAIDEGEKNVNADSTQ
jgi:hypothetical protein